MAVPGSGLTGNDVVGQPLTMRLNQLPSDSGSSAGGQKNLASSPAEKKAAAKAIEDHIEPDTRRAGAWADAETSTAIKGFRDGWNVSGALKKAHAAWGEQVQNLMNRLASEKAALRGTSTLLQNTDIHVAQNTRPVSVIDNY